MGKIALNSLTNRVGRSFKANHFRHLTHRAVTCIASGEDSEDLVGKPSRIVRDVVVIDRAITPTGMFAPATIEPNGIHLVTTDVRVTEIRRSQGIAINVNLSSELSAVVGPNMPSTRAPTAVGNDSIRRMIDSTSIDLRDHKPKLVLVLKTHGGSLQIIITVKSQNVQSVLSRGTGERSFRAIGLRKMQAVSA